MGKKAELTINESSEELTKLRKKQTTLTNQKRIIALQRIQTKAEPTRLLLAKYLGIHKSTLERWVNKYKQGGVDGLLEVKPRRLGSKIITAEIHSGLEQRVTDPKNSFAGYWDAHRWVIETYGIEINYFWLRQYMIKNFGTKVKHGRKSHVKKDPEAIEAFLKTTLST